MAFCFHTVYMFVVNTLCLTIVPVVALRQAQLVPRWLRAGKRFRIEHSLHYYTVKSHQVDSAFYSSLDRKMSISFRTE